MSGHQPHCELTMTAGYNGPCTCRPRGRRVGTEIHLDPALFYGPGGRGVWHKIPVDQGRITLWVMAHPEDIEGYLRVREGDNVDYATLPGLARLPGDSKLCVATRPSWEFGHFAIWSDDHV